MATHRSRFRLALALALFPGCAVEALEDEPTPDPIAEGARALTTPEVLRVACIGDSLTAPVPASGNTSPYPNYLQAMLGPKYQVGGYWISTPDGYALEGFGRPGSTLIAVPPFVTGSLETLLGNPPSHPAYKNAEQFAPSRDFNPNIVVIMLGSNDSTFAPAPFNTWSQTFASMFVSQYIELIESYRALPTHPEVFINIPAHLYGATKADNAFGLDPAVVNGVLPGLIQQIAAATHAKVIDVNTPTQGMPENFPDVVHPNNAASYAIADAVADAILANDQTRAFYVKTDSSTKGAWKGVYGLEAFNVSQDPSANNPTVAPAIVGGIAGQQNTVWSASTSDPRALQRTASGSIDRVAGAWSSAGGELDLYLSLTDGRDHQVALYVVDWDGNDSRVETIEVRDSVSGRVLDTRTVRAFSGGKYLVWNVQGNVSFHVVGNVGSAVVSGEFVDAVQLPLGHVVTLEAQSNDLFVTAENGGASPLVANRAAAAGWEQFLVVDASQGAGNGAVALRALANGKYVAADAGSPQLIASSTSPSAPASVFGWSTFPDGAIALKASNGLFVTADPTPLALTASRAVASGWEAFVWSTP